MSHCCDLARVFGSVVDGARSQIFYLSRFAFRMPGSIPRPARYQGWVLEPGDALYLPPRLAHHGVSQDEVRMYNAVHGGDGGISVTYH